MIHCDLMPPLLHTLLGQDTLRLAGEQWLQHLIMLHHRAYDMAALKLKGYDRATTNFPKETYHTEPFMLVRSATSPPARHAVRVADVSLVFPRRLRTLTCVHHIGSAMMRAQMK